MSLLTLCQSALQYAGITSAPSAIVGNSDPNATLALAAAQLAGQSIARRPEGGWVSQIKEYDFQTAATTVTAGTIANSGNAIVTIPSGSAAALQPLLNDLNATVPKSNWYASGAGIPNNAIVQTVVLSGGNYLISLNMVSTITGSGQYAFGQSDYPLPSDFQRPIDNTFWDRSRFWSMRGPQSPQQWQLYKSSVIGKASIQRRYRFRQIIPSTGGAGTMQLSIDPAPFDNAAQLVFEYVSNAWCQSATGTPQSSWQADTDTGVIDEYLLQLEVIWRVLRRLGLSYSEEMAEAERQVDKALAVDGAAAILDMTPNSSLALISPANLPETSYGVYTGLGPP